MFASRKLRFSTVVVVLGLVGWGLQIPGQAGARLTDGLIAYWPMDEGTGTTIHDASGHHNDGRLQGGTWVPGWCSFGLELTSSGMVYNIPSTFDTSIHDSMTFTAWVDFFGPNPSGARSTIFDSRNGSDGGFLVSIGAACQNLATSLLIESDMGEEITSSTPIPHNQWTHVAMVMDYPTNSLRLYLNGTADEWVLGACFPYHPDVGWTAAIGNNHWAPPYAPLNGRIDEVAIWNRVLSPTEIDSVRDCGLFFHFNPSSVPEGISAKAEGVELRCLKTAGPEVNLTYSLPRTGNVLLEVLDLEGRLQAVLVNEEQVSGPHEVTWQGRTTTGQLLSSGVYFARLSADGRVRGAKLIIAR